MKRVSPLVAAILMAKMTAELGPTEARKVLEGYRIKLTGKGRNRNSGICWPVVPWSRNKYARTFNGRREVARRRRQIECGQLQVSR